MRTQFIQVETIEEAYNEAPWAAEIVEVEGGGWMAFESLDDLTVWENHE